jgi:hypothetical protein
MADPATQVRVYVPATWDDLAALWSDGSQQARHGAFAVTAALRDDDPDAADEEWEFQAFTQAAAASLAMLTDSAVARRVVVSVDVPAEAVSEDSALAWAAVVLDEEVGVHAVVAVHVDGSESIARIQAVLDGGPVDSLDDVALEWYAPSEVAGLLT